MSSKKEARKAKKRARAADEVELLPARAAGTGERRGPPVAPTSGRLSGTVVNDEWQTLRRSCVSSAPVPRPPDCSAGKNRFGLLATQPGVSGSATTMHEGSHSAQTSKSKHTISAAQP